MEALDLARLEFAVTTSMHFLFAALTLGLAPLVALMQTLWVARGDPVYERLTKFWGLPDPAGPAGPAGPNTGQSPLDPYALLFGGAVVALLALHGAAFAAVRMTREPREVARRLVRRLVLPVLGLLVVLVAALAVVGAGSPLSALPIGLVVLAAVALGGVALRKGHDGRTFAATTVATASLPLMVGAGLASGLLEGAADPVTLTRLAVIVLPVVPLVIAAQALLWWTFRRRVDERSVIFF